MGFKHRLKNIDEEAFLFYFRHQNIRALDNLIDLWQDQDRKDEIPLDHMKLNFILILTLLSRLIVKDGYSSETIFAKTEFMIDLVWDYDDLQAFQTFEKK